MPTSRESEGTGVRAILVSLLFSLGLSPGYIFLAKAFNNSEVVCIFFFLAPLLGWSLVASWKTRYSRSDEDGAYLLSRLTAVWSALPIIMNLLVLFFQELEHECLANFFLSIKFWSLLIAVVLAAIFSIAKSWWEELRTE